MERFLHSPSNCDIWHLDLGTMLEINGNIQNMLIFLMLQIAFYCNQFGNSFEMVKNMSFVQNIYVSLN